MTVLIQKISNIKDYIDNEAINTLMKKNKIND